MYTERLILVAAFAALTATLAMPHPAPEHHIRSVDLNEAINKSLCPIELEIDDDPNRVPQRIKVMKCAKEPNRWCQAQHIPRHECCHSHGTHQKECVEMRDTVLVYYKNTKTTSTYEVSVGCTCMIEQSTRAPLLPDGPS
ncbi:unnamed protein product [Euphydryas editha]|uniref:Uncharacterized protein n=1 Tax=Euphydryas editha TaxID=104508 RepID=A0AAU9U0C7_EUPED|nr:unnamed protein product [Euphydryas editha]